MDDCIFCKIVRSEIPCKKVFEDEKFLAFLDIEPFTEGHILIVPKTHYRWVYDVPNFGEYWEFVKKTTEIIQAKLNPVFISYLTMGNDVPHAHIHLIPRYQDDKLIGVFGENLRSKPDSMELNKILDKIKS